MKISMNAEFHILKNSGNGGFVPVTDQEITDVSVGGYEFHIGEYKLPFDWTAFECGWDKNGFLSLDTGFGWFFNDFELDECYEEQYVQLGLSRDDISAAFLASVHHIEDFYVNFVCNEQECEAGYWSANNDGNAAFRLQLLRVRFEDRETGVLYEVDPKVVEAFNRGEKIRSLESVLADASIAHRDAPDDAVKQQTEFIKED